MYKTKKLVKYIEGFKKTIIKQVKEDDIVKIKYSGSFNDRTKKWFSDADVRVLIDTPELGDKISLIRRIVKSLRDKYPILHVQYRVGFEDYYYREKYTLSYMNKLHREGRIDDQKLDVLEKYFDPYDHGSIKKNLKDVLDIDMSYTGLMRNTEELKKYINRENRFVIKYIIEYGKGYIPIDLGINTYQVYQKFIDTRIGNDSDYLETNFSAGLYYHYLKRLGSRLFFNKRTVGLAKEIKGVIRNQERYISQNYQKVSKALVEGDKKEEKRLEMELEKHFEKLARKYKKRVT
jgi:hypothetical protein